MVGTKHKRKKPTNSSSSDDPKPKKPKNKGGKGGRKGRKHKYTAKKADKYELYQLAVQSPEGDVEFLAETYRDLRGKEARHFREDFCGTCLLSSHWVAAHEENTAEGFDIDPEPVEWGRERNIATLGDAASRLSVHLEDARAPGERAPDIRVAQNFSYSLFKEREELLAYFRLCRESLADDGIFVIDLFGGTEGTDELEEEREVEEGFTYVWDQHEYFPGTGEYLCYIHFNFNDGSRMRKAFTYEWRYWSMTELKDIMRDAGFSQVRSYFEGDDEDDDGEGNGEFEYDERGENCAGWIAYLVGVK